MTSRLLEFIAFESGVSEPFAARGAGLYPRRALQRHKGEGVVGGGGARAHQVGGVPRLYTNTRTERCTRDSCAAPGATRSARRTPTGPGRRRTIQVASRGA